MGILDGINGVIFDMDGTLIDSMGMWSDSGKIYLDAVGLQPKGDTRLVRFGVEYNELTREFMARHGIDRDLYAVKRDIELLVAERYFHTLQLKSGVRELLESLSSRGVAMSVATATSSLLANMCFKRLRIDGFFTAVLSTKDIGVNKYSPDVYNLAAESMGTAVCETAVFEDALYAARTAKNAGYRVVGVYDEMFDEGWEELKQLCDFAVRDYGELTV